MLNKLVKLFAFSAAVVVSTSGMVAFAQESANTDVELEIAAGIFVPYAADKFDNDDLCTDTEFSQYSITGGTGYVAEAVDGSQFTDPTTQTPLTTAGEGGFAFTVTGPTTDATGTAVIDATGAVTTLIFSDPGTGWTEATPDPSVTTNFTITPTNAGVQAGGSGANFDAVVLNTLLGDAVVCTTEEKTIDLGSLSVSTERQTTSATLYDAGFVDQRGNFLPDYTITMSMGHLNNLTNGNTGGFDDGVNTFDAAAIAAGNYDQADIVLGSNPDAQVADVVDLGCANQPGNGLIYACTQFAASDIDGWAPQAAIDDPLAVGYTDEGANEAVTDITTQIDLFSGLDVTAVGGADYDAHTAAYTVAGGQAGGVYLGEIVTTFNI